MGPPAGYQKWRALLFVHWEVPVDALRPLVPAPLSIDTFDGKAYVGLVPFTMQDVRPLRWLPAIPGTADFHETNLRTYVHLDGEAPGVWFFSLDAANALAVWAARTFFHLPYYSAQMALEQHAEAVTYSSRRLRGEAHLQLRYRIGADRPPSVPGTLHFFLAERYYLYASGGSQGLLRGQVHHVAYPLREAIVDELDQTIVRSAGLPEGGARTPDLFSPGVDVEIFGLKRVR